MRRAHPIDRCAVLPHRLAGCGGRCAASASASGPPVPAPPSPALGPIFARPSPPAGRVGRPGARRRLYVLTAVCSTCPPARSPWRRFLALRVNVAADFALAFCSGLGPGVIAHGWFAFLPIADRKLP